MNRFTFRLDAIYENTERHIQNFLEKYTFDKYLIYREVASKTKKIHYQGIIYWDRSYNSYKRYANDHFIEYKGDGKHKGHRSFTEVKEDRYEIYITKGKNLAFSKGYTREEIEFLESQSFDVKIDTKPYNFMDNLYQYCLQHVEKEGTYYKHTSIVHCVLDYFKENSKCFDATTVAKFVNIIALKLNDCRELRHELVDRVMEKVIIDF